MSIEKMVMVNMVGHMDDLDQVSKKVVLFGELQPVSALQEIDTNDFTLSANEDNLDALIDVCYIRPYNDDKNYNELSKLMKKIKNISGTSRYNSIRNDELIMDGGVVENSIKSISDEFNDMNDEIERLKCEKNDLEEIKKYLEYIKDLEISFEELLDMKYFNFDIFQVSKENMLKLKENYENIPAIVMNVYKGNEFDIVMVFTPVMLKKETERIFKSLNCQNVNLGCGCKGTPAQILQEIKSRLKDLNDEMNQLNKRLKKSSDEKKKMIKQLDRSLELEIKAYEVKSNVACTKEFFYLCGWVPKRNVKELEDSLEGIVDRLIIVEKDVESINNKTIVTPTKLRNNIAVRPFESMVGMYGVPSYNEIDPTNFLGISYMIMFGAMFGDLGQGIVFIIMGLLLKYKKFRPNLGGVLARLGMSSSIFGIIYGSFFGNENVIPSRIVVVHPMEDISDILLVAVVFGCALLIMGFVYSLINNFRRKDMENGLFGKDGLAGMIFYISLLYLAVSKFMNLRTLPTVAWVVLLVSLLAIILFKEPLANAIKGKRPLYNESKGDYFIEGGFGVAEILLSMFSNTVSFVRVGAFALNHVGLFVAFQALAKMMSNNMGSILILVLGNLIIIGLEGLIVFIQGLRLEYYELFSKYYEGAGTSFAPVRLADNGILEKNKSKERFIKRKMNSNLVND